MDLHDTQKIVAKDKHRFRVLNSGRQWGKTTLAVQEMLAYAYYKSNSKICYIAPTFAQARDIAWRLLKDATRSIWAKDPNESRLELTIKTRDGKESEVWLRGYENIEGLRGQQFDFLVIDEVATMKNWTYGWEAVLEPTLLIRKGQALFISTPNGYNHFFNLYNLEHTNSDYKSFTYTSYDNPYADKELLDKKRSDPSNTTEYFEQEYMAKFTKVFGAVYKEWDETKQFVKLNYDANLPLYLSFDWGINDPTSIMWVQPYGSEYRVIDYYEAVDANIEHYISLINAKPYKKPDLYTGDPAGKQRSLTTGTSVIEILASKGIFVRSKDGVKIIDQIRATHGIIPRLYVSNKLPRVRDCLLNYRYPETKGGIDQSNEVPIHDEYSHGMRALEYLCVNIGDTPVTGATVQGIIADLPKEDLFQEGGWY